MNRPLRVLAAPLIAGIGVAILARPWLRRANDAVVSDEAAEPRRAASSAERGSPSVPVAAAANAPREAIGDGDDVPPSVPAEFDELRFVVAGMGLDSLVSGAEVRAAILDRPGTYLRFRSEADRAAFLEARFRAPLEAGMPPEAPPGTRLHPLAGAIEAAGFEVLLRPPLVRVGPRQPGSASGPR